LQEVLDEMPGQKRTAIQMVYLHGKRYQDAADTMKISINSLKTHLKTGLKILRGEINSKIN
jgi:RNA polymerase sigma-70 factor (ECF subfamily)